MPKRKMKHRDWSVRVAQSYLYGASAAVLHGDAASHESGRWQGDKMSRIFDVWATFWEAFGNFSDAFGHIFGQRQIVYQDKLLDCELSFPFDIKMDQFTW